MQTSKYDQCQLAAIRASRRVRVSGQNVQKSRKKHSRGHLATGDAATATRLSDVMTCRYSQVDMQTTVHNRYRPEHCNRGQGLLATADVGFTVLRRRPVPLTDGPPNDEYIVFLNIASLHTHLHIDHVCRKIAERATLLAGSDIPKSPLGWVRQQTLKVMMAATFPAT